MRKGLWKKILLVLLPLVILALMALLDPNVADISEVIRQIDPLWFIAAVGSMLLYYYFDVLMYQLACKYMEAPQPLGESVLTTMLGFFYSALTPFSSGGQPMQVLQMRRRGMRVGVATSVLMLKLLAWQFTLTLLGTLGFIFISGDVLEGGITMIVLYIIGYLLCLGILVVALLAFTKPDWIFRTGESLIDFLARHRLIKKAETVENIHKNWKRIIVDYQGAVRFALKQRLGMFLIWLVSAGEAAAYMAVTYFIYRGLGFSTHGFLYVVLLQGLLYIAVCFVPLPGASIASEGGFYMVFAKLFTPAARFPALLLWRLITYYSALGLGLIAVVADGLRPKTVLPENAEEEGE